MTRNRLISAALCALALIAAVPLGGCGANMPSMGEVSDAFDAGTMVLEALDAAEVSYLESLPVPTPGDIARAESHAAMALDARAHLKSARDDIRSGNLRGARRELSAALDDMSAIADELTALGVKLPPEVERGLSLLRTLAGPAPAS